MRAFKAIIPPPQDAARQRDFMMFLTMARDRWPCLTVKERCELAREFERRLERVTWVIAEATARLESQEQDPPAPRRLRADNDDD